MTEQDIRMHLSNPHDGPVTPLVVMARATELVTEIAGLDAGEVADVAHDVFMERGWLTSNAVSLDSSSLEDHPIYNTADGR